MTRKEMRRLARLACQIHAERALASPPAADIVLPEDAWRRTERLQRSWRQAQSRGWRVATSGLQTQLGEAVTRLSAMLQDQLRRLQEQPPQFASPREMYDDLVALSDEFEGVDWNRHEAILAVETGSVVLEGRYLGPFRIELCWRENLASAPYRVIALDPHPAAQDEGTTHPHVQSEQLCAGEGRRGITAALRAGRWFDFFLLVGNVLRTYNSASPFVSLDRWDGTVCHECDVGLGEEDAYCCCRCKHDLCEDCRRGCGACGETLCAGCAVTCDVCDEELCEPCSAVCERCSRTCRSSCLFENQHCEICHENNETQPTARPSAEGTHAPV